jgi:hypothetical protein
MTMLVWFLKPPGLVKVDRNVSGEHTDFNFSLE